MKRNLFVMVVASLHVLACLASDTPSNNNVKSVSRRSTFSLSLTSIAESTTSLGSVSGCEETDPSSPWASARVEISAESQRFGEGAFGLWMQKTDAHVGQAPDQLIALVVLPQASAAAAYPTHELVHRVRRNATALPVFNLIRYGTSDVLTAGSGNPSFQGSQSSYCCPAGLACDAVAAEPVRSVELVGQDLQVPQVEQVGQLGCCSIS